MPTAMIGSAQHWTAPIQLSAHHLARYLSKRGWRVCFVSTPTSFMHRLWFYNDPIKRERYRLAKNGMHYDANEKIHYYTPLTYLPPSRFPVLRRQWFFDSWPQFTHPQLQKTLDLHGFSRPDVVIFDSVVMNSVWELLGRPKLVYRVTDNNADFPGLPKLIPIIEKQAAQHARLVTYTGFSLERYVDGLDVENTLCVPNGVDFSHFATAMAPPEEYKDIPEPRALYVGSIASWFDEGLVKAAACKSPDTSFVIIGPGSKSLKKLANQSNVYLLGARSYQHMPAYLQHAQVGLIPFKPNGNQDFFDNINPLKLYEYMAAGLPVVSTAINQVIMLKSPAKIAKNKHEFSAAIIKSCNSLEQKIAEKNFAKSHDWEHQFRTLQKHMINIINS